jgi:hypothetical protein
MYKGMTVETVSITGHNGDKISAYTARPEGKGPFPGIFSSEPGRASRTSSPRKCAPKAAFPTRRRSAIPKAR